MNYLWVGFGGAIGAICRYIVATLFIQRKMVEFPYATLTVNIVGSLLMGFLAFWLVSRFAQNASLRLFLLVGILGGFTTFSAFSLDTLDLLLANRYLMSVLYIGLSFIGCIVAVTIGMLIAKQIH